MGGRADFADAAEAGADGARAVPRQRGAARRAARRRPSVPARRALQPRRRGLLPPGVVPAQLSRRRRRCSTSSRRWSPGPSASTRWATGSASDMDADEALRIATRQHARRPRGGADPREPNGLAPGTRVAVVPDDYGFDPVAGEVVASSVHEIAVRRTRCDARRDRRAFPAHRLSHERRQRDLAD